MSLHAPASAHLTRLLGRCGGLAAAAVLLVAPAARAAAPAAPSISVINSTTDQPVAGLAPLGSPASLNLATIAGRQVTFQAFTSPSTVGSVVFVLDGVRRVENGAPYAWLGENSATDLIGFTPSTGSHTLSTTAFSGGGATGDASPTRTYALTVVDNATGTPPPVTPPPVIPATKPFPTSWSDGAPSPAARFESTALTVGSKIYVFGGFRDDHYRVHRSYATFDIPSNRWTMLGDLPAGMAETHLGAATDGRYIYLAGGLGGDYVDGVQANQVVSARVYRYDTTNNAWAQIANLPAPRGGGGLALVGGQLHWIGGVGPDNVTDFRDHWIYDLATSRWSTGASMPEAKDHFSTAVFGGRIYALAGEFGHHVNRQQKTSVHAYDPLTNTWQQRASAPLAKSHDESATYVADGRIVMAGGQINDFYGTSQVQSYDPLANAWSTLAPLPTVRQGVIVQRYGNRVAVTTGGVYTNGPMANTWLGTL